jgi:hypothetical protein
MRRVNRVRALTVALVILSPAVVAAQGNGHGHAYGLNKNQGSAPSAAGAPTVTPAGTTAVRHFGSWLDDASLLPEGQAALSFGFGYWRAPSYREFDVPSVDASLGLTRRVQVGASLPYFRANQPGGPLAHGVGDVYLSSKIQLRDPSSASHRAGFSIAPIVEVLSYAPEPGASRVSWALPFSAELQREGWRVYGSTGYFSRGSVFASGAIEVAVADRAWLTGALTQSHVVNDRPALDALGLARTRTDVSGGLAVALTPAWSVYGSLGRTLSRQDPDSATLVLSGGVSWSLAAWTPRAAGKKMQP